MCVCLKEREIRGEGGLLQQDGDGKEEKRCERSLIIDAWARFILHYVIILLIYKKGKERTRGMAEQRQCLGQPATLFVNNKSSP